MSLHLAIEAAGQAAVVAAALGIAAAVKALASVLRTWIEQASCTRRLSKALEDSRPNERPEIIMACSQLEGKPAGEGDGGAADGRLPALGHPRPPAVILQDKRNRERRGD